MNVASRWKLRWLRWSAPPSDAVVEVAIRLHPLEFGIARIGDCRDSFLIGPEAPGVTPTGPFRGKDKGIKPQAARFRIYKVEVDAQENEVVSEEIVAASVVCGRSSG